MIGLRVDGRQVRVGEGATLLEAARNLGIRIPTLCHGEGLPHHTSCMVCLVEDEATGSLQPACATPASEGVSIRTDTRRAVEARRASLELLLSEHAGDCEAPCARACPAHPDIPRVIRLMAAGDPRAALETLLDRLPLAGTLAAICPAPCEKSCRRVPLDGAVGIRAIKRAAVEVGLVPGSFYTPRAAPSTGRRVVVVGAGPAGLSAAFHLARNGHRCLLIDERERPGDAMRAAAGAARLPAEILEADVALVLRMGVELVAGRAIGSREELAQLREEHDAVVLAVGSGERLAALAPGVLFDGKTRACGLPGIFACGNATRLSPSHLAVQAVADGGAAAFSVNRYLAGLALQPTLRRFDSHFGRMDAADIGEIARMRAERASRRSTGGSAGAGAKAALIEAGRCLRCDCARSHSCRLRLLADERGADGRRFPGEEHRRLARVVGANGLSFEPGKCIKCGICVRIAERDGDRPGLGFTGRGFGTRVAVPFGADIGSALPSTARECVSRCPTGALAWER